MVLEFKFKYLSNNDEIIHILNNILSKKQTIYKINKSDDFIYLYIEDEEEKLLRISDEISLKLPFSIFLTDFTLEVVPQVPNIKNYYTPLSQKKSFCSNCLSIVENEENSLFNVPFFDCGVCGTTCDVNKFFVKEDGKDLKYNNFNELFELIARKLLENKKIKINNTVFENFKNLEKENETLLCTNINNLSNLVVGSKQKSLILQSLEKPIISFNLNKIYQKNNDCKIKKVNIKTPWNLFLYLLSKQLKNLGIDFLKQTKEEDFSLEIFFEDKFQACKISICENKIFLLENKAFDKELLSIYNKTNEQHMSQFLVLLHENKLYDKTILNFYLSSKNSDAISLYSPKIDGIIDILKLKLPKDISEVLKKIMKDENGEKLIENYKTKFPKEFLNALNFDMTKFKENSFLNLFELISTLLGIDNLFEKAKEALLQRGPRIDYLLKENDKLFNRKFDLKKFIKSGISFKLAGVDDKTLALGYVENMAYFISDLIDEVQEQFPLDGISFCGDLIADEFFNKLINKTLSRNYKLYYNKDFPIQL